jgi:uncharacterized membrane protein HdeD (DUF308 family)
MESLVRRWWMPVVRGLFAIAFGVLCFVAPGSSLFALVLLFGAYALVDGVLNLGHAIGGGRQNWPALLFSGLVGIAAGVLTFMWPKITAVALVLVIAAWAIITGVAALVAAVKLRKAIHGEWLLALEGVLSIALGVLLFLRPGAGALALVIWIGAYAVVSGILLLALGFRLRSLGRSHRGPSEPRVGHPISAAPPGAPA